MTRHQVHAQVRLRLAYASNPDLKLIADKLELLGRNRNRANYEMQPHPMFASAADARNNAQIATDTLALLDAIDTDPVRRAAAIASIRP